MGQPNLYNEQNIYSCFNIEEVIILEIGYAVFMGYTIELSRFEYVCSKCFRTGPLNRSDIASSLSSLFNLLLK
jgi:hypothetical protein